MHLALESTRVRPVLWWLAVFLVAYALKHHYSVTPASGLDWMLRPLAQLLEILTGQPFQRDIEGEWVSPGADVRLVKACAGVNFMLMSFLAYAWIMRPDCRSQGAGSLSWGGVRLSLLCLAILSAWLTALFANGLRILLAMEAESRGWRLDAVGLHAADVHRLIGMLVYLPLLSLQMMADRRATGAGIVAAPLLLYLLLTLLVPLLTGNAWRDPALFLRHLSTLAFAGATVTAIPALLCRCVAWSCSRLDINR